MREKETEREEERKSEIARHTRERERKSEIPKNKTNPNVSPKP